MASNSLYFGSFIWQRYFIYRKKFHEIMNNVSSYQTKSSLNHCCSKHTPTQPKKRGKGIQASIPDSAGSCGHVHDFGSVILDRESTEQCFFSSTPDQELEA